MTMKVKTLKHFGFIALAAGMFSCVEDNNSPGLEYMPDMYRSSAVEGYWDYAEVRGKYSEEAYDLVREKFSFVPPAGTIPYVGSDVSETDMPYEHGAPLGADKTHGLYGIRQDTAGYANAAFDKNPVPYSDEVLKEGQVLFERFCIHCHGEKGAGDGTVPSTGKYPPPPAYDGPLKDLPAGQIFYSITYGKNAMGSHASQLNKEERWKVVYYVQKLQGNEPGAEQVAADTMAVEGVNIEEGAEDAPEVLEAAPESADGGRQH